MAVLGSVGAASSAHAQDFGTELTGTWRVFSDGEWARTNGVLIDERSTLETWSVTSSCVSPIECYGEVQSDAGWTAPLRLDAFYYVEREIPNWMPCPDGTFATGYQMFLLWGVNRATEETVSRDIQTIAGRNITKSVSGACGVNQPKVIELPVRAEKLS